MSPDAEPGKYPCPFCGSQHSRTLHTRWFAGVRATWRRRECQDCSARFSTHETLLTTEPALRLHAGLIQPSTCCP